jgi:hypothetical protein
MNDPFIPMNAYIFIGVASLVLAFVTVMDNQPIESNESEVNENEKSFTEYLPTFNGSNETVNEVAKEPTGETSNPPPQNDMFNSNLNSDQGLAQNEYQPQPPQPPQPEPQTPPPQNDMFNSNLNSDQGLAQNEAPLLPQPQQGQPQTPPPQNDMFNSNLNSDQGLAQNEAPLLPQPQVPVQQKQYGNPFTGGKNKTGKNNATKNVTKNGKSKRNKKTKRYNSK